MTVLRCLDCVLEPTTEKALEQLPRFHFSRGVIPEGAEQSGIHMIESVGAISECSWIQGAYCIFTP